jgi:hypothetical protein
MPRSVRALGMSAREFCGREVAVTGVWTMMTRKTWMLASALLLVTACNDDEDHALVQTGDAGRDASTLPTGEVSIDAGSIDSGTASLDAGLVDASVTTDSSVDASLPDPIAIAGNWHDESFTGETRIDATTFGYATLIEYDNAQRVAYTQNSASDPYGPNQFSKWAWTAVVDGGFYLCTVDFGKDTLAAAKATTMTADATDPAKSGCGGFAWSHLVPAIAISGSWKSGADVYAIDSDALNGDLVVSYDNAAKSLITSADNATNVTKFSKLVWAQPNASTLYLCSVGSDFVNEVDAAAASTASVDASNTATGCHGGAWTALAKQ